MLAPGKKFKKNRGSFGSGAASPGTLATADGKISEIFDTRGSPGIVGIKGGDKKMPPPLWKTAKILIFVVRMVRMQDAAGDTEESVLDGRAEAEAQQTGRYGYKETTSFLLQAWQEQPAGLQGCPQYRTRW